MRGTIFHYSGGKAMHNIAGIDIASRKFDYRIISGERSKSFQRQLQDEP